MLPVIVAIFLALSIVGGGVVYAAENAPPSSPLHGVQVAVNNTATTLHLAAPPANLPTDSVVHGKTPTSGKAESVSATHPNADKDENQPKATRTPLPPTITAAFATAEADVNQLADDQLVPGQSQRGLDAKLDAAQNALSHGDTQGASDILNAFVHDLNAKQRSGHISSDDYATLYDQYTALLKLVSPSATPLPTVTANDNHAENGQAHQDQNKHEDDTDATATPIHANGVLTATPTPLAHGNGNANGQKDHGR